MLSIDATATLVGHRCWLESACFELLGGWVPSVLEPTAKLLLATHSRHHGWRAQLFAEVLPATRAHDPERLVRPADDRWAAALAVAADPADAPALARLAGVYQALLPRLVADDNQTLDAARPWSDGPVARRLRLVVEEERADLAEGLALVEALVAAGGDPDRTARRRAAVEAALPPR